MKIRIIAFITFVLLQVFTLDAQTTKLNKNNLEPIHVYILIEHLGEKVIKVIKDSTIKTVDQPTFVKVRGVDFKDGSIEVNVLSKLLPNAPAQARGFIGLAFRINDDNSKFECIYIRPVNGRAENQLQRNHSIQYFSYPEYDFERFRKESPGQYEAYTDMELNKWIKLKIIVKGTQAKLFLNNNKQPSLIINDLKHGADLSGTIGLWVDVGTEGYFSDLKIFQD